MQHGPLILLSPGRCGSTLAQRLINAVDGWYLFGEHAGAFSHLVDVRELLETRAATQKKYGDMIVDKAEGLSGEWSAWASPFSGADLHRVFAQALQELYATRLPDRCVWGFKEVRYSARDAIIFSEIFERPCIVILRRNFADFCRSYCLANLEEIDLSAFRARQLVLHYVSFFSQLETASAIAKAPFLPISYEEICAAPQRLIDLVAGHFGWQVTPDDRANVERAAQHVIDYVPSSRKTNSICDEFVAFATDLYRNAVKS
jgi:hypothetical protein